MASMDRVIKDKNGHPLILFHFTPHEVEVNKFKPYTHFGTCQAAHERMAGRCFEEGVRIFPVFLKMTNPLRVKDSGDLDIFFGARELIAAGVSQKKLEWIYEPLLTKPVDKNSFHEAAKLAHSWQDFDPNLVSQKYPEGKKLRNIFDMLSNIFSSSSVGVISQKNIYEELKTGAVFPLEILCRIQKENDFGRSRVCLKDQRKILALEELGYDGLVYKNTEEDYGKDSYCIFRPNQVISAIGYDWNGQKPNIKIDFSSYRLEHYYAANSYALRLALA